MTRARKRIAPGRRSVAGPEVPVVSFTDEASAVDAPLVRAVLGEAAYAPSQVVIAPSLTSTLARFAFTHPTTLEDLAEFHRRVKAMQWPRPYSVDVRRIDDRVLLEVRIGDTRVKQVYKIS